MPYTGKTVTTEFRGGLNILASEHFQFIEGAPHWTPLNLVRFIFR